MVEFRVSRYSFAVWYIVSQLNRRQLCNTLLIKVVESRASTRPPFYESYAPA